MKKVSYLLTIVIFLSSCIHTGPVRTELHNAYPSRSVPKDFQSPLFAIHELREEIQNNQKSKIQSQPIEYQKRMLKTLIDEQIRLERELQKNGVISLVPGKSYSFELESFCVNAGKERPIADDGHRLGPMKGPAESWLPQFLKKYKNSNVKQSDAQNLIWSLLSGSRFDELSSDQKANLLKIFPDAPLRFGISQIEKPATSFLKSFIPTEINQAKDQFYQYRSILNDASSSYKNITETLAPIPSRTDPIPMGWVQTKEGYFAKAESISGYSSVRIDLFIPLSITTPITFDPTNFIAIPAKSQRLAISPNSLLQWYQEASNHFLNSIAGHELTTQEQELIRKYPIDSLKIATNMKQAFDYTSDAFPGIKAHNNQADAYRHFIWSAMNARDVGVERARDFGTAHEMNPMQNPSEKNMDLWNNDQGFEYGGKFPYASDQDIQNEGKKRIRDGRLKTRL